MADETKSKNGFTGALDLFKPSKQAVLKNLTVFLLIIFLPGFLTYLGDLVNGQSSFTFNTYFKSAESDNSAGLFYLLGGLLGILLLPAGSYLELLASKGKDLSVSEAINGSLKYFWRIIGLVIVSIIIIALGFLLLIVPGLIAIQRLFLAPYFLINQDLSIKEALRASSEASKNHAGAIWGIIGVFILLSLTGFIPLVGGILSGILITLYSCAPAMRYLEFKALSKG